MSDRPVRQPYSEPADPFGDTSWPAGGARPADPYGVAAPPAPAKRTVPTPAAIEVPLGFEPEPAPDGQGGPFPSFDDLGSTRSSIGSTFGGLLAAGTARVVVGLVILAITTGGFGFFVDLSNDGPPNVPTHVLDACRAARLDADLAASIGRHVDYRQDGGDQVVTFETPAGDEWTCRGNPSAGWATVNG